MVQRSDACFPSDWPVPVAGHLSGWDRTGCPIVSCKMQDQKDWSEEVPICGLDISNGLGRFMRHYDC